MNPPELRTERLLLRPLAPADAQALHRLVNDYSVAGNLARVPFPYPEGLAQDWIASTHAQMARGEAFDLAISDAQGALMGCVGLTVKRGASEAELGYWLGRRFWGKGYGREAAKALARWGFDVLGLDRIVASALTDNIASQKVLRDIGFQPLGEGTAHFMSRNRHMPVYLFSMDKPQEVEPAPALPVLLVVAVALVDTDGRILLAQRPPGKALAGLWEFPGGKLNPGEGPETALIRELKEELDIDVTASCLAPLTFASHAYEKFHLLMPLYVCRRWKGMLRPVEGQQLAWVRPNKLEDYPMPPADKPLIAMLREML